MIRGEAATRLRGVLGAVTAITVVASGCSSVIGGEAVKDPAVAADAVNTALLRPGNYDTTPYPAPKTAVNGRQTCGCSADGGPRHRSVGGRPRAH